MTKLDIFNLLNDKAQCIENTCEAYQDLFFEFQRTYPDMYKFVSLRTNEEGKYEFKIARNAY